MHHVTHDPAVFPDSEVSDGLRFYKKRLANPDKDSEHQFAAVSASIASFGYGRFAYPGRGFAAAQLKLLLGLLINEFDFSFLPEKGRAWLETLCMGDMVLPNPSIEILVRKALVV